MSKTFKELLQESQKKYKFTIKLAVDEVTDCMLDCIERSLQKYELESATKFKSTPIQESPLDFPNIKNSAVHISDIVISYPASRDMLRTILSNSLGLPLSTVAVYSENDPRAIETELHLERNSPDFVEKYQAKLGTDFADDCNACEGMSPEEQKMSLLKDLAATSAERKGKLAEIGPTYQDALDTGDVPAGYHDFDKQVFDEQPGLFGRLSVKKAYEYVRK